MHAIHLPFINPLGVQMEIMSLKNHLQQNTVYNTASSFLNVGFLCIVTFSVFSTVVQFAEEPNLLNGT